MELHSLKERLALAVLASVASIVWLVLFVFVPSTVS